MSALVMITAPAVEPVTLEEARDHLRVDSDAEDALISELIAAARQWCEQHTGRQFVTATFDWHVDMLAGTLEVPRAPLQSVTSITYLDSDGAQQTLAGATYRVDAYSIPARLALGYAQSWPALYGVVNAATVRFVAGYGDAAQDVPAPIRQAILLLTAELYEQRQESVPLAFSGTPFGVTALLHPYRVLTI